jgi:hyperosmotically inducible protein
MAPALRSTLPIALSRALASLAVLALAGALAGCEKKTTVSDAPGGGTVTHTTISPSPQASEAMRQINETMGHAASAIESGAAASQALTKAGDAIEDGVITTKIKAALLTDPDVKGSQVGVDTRQGVVTLTGTVSTASGLERANRIARDTEGVKSVDSQVVVKAAS